MGDYFKIVAVIKNWGASSSVSYSYVPHKWECDGWLYWPLSNLHSLRSDPATQPDMTTWKKFKCKVKKDKIFGIDEAELWEEEFVNLGTDAEENSAIMPKVCQETTRLDTLFSQINAGRGETDDATGPIILYTEPSHNAEAETITSEVLPPGSHEKLEQLLKNQEEILANQKRLFEYVASEFLEAKATYDRIYKMMKCTEKGGNSTVDTAENGNELYAKRFTFPLSTVEEVLKFNKEIESDTNFKDYLLMRLCAIGGTSGNEEGRNIARKLKAILFTEHVLTMFSWTGISRTAGLEKKEAFQACEGILKFFLEVIRMADDRWSEVKNEKFFKFNTLKHAKQAEKAVKKKEEKKKAETIVVEPLLPDIEAELDDE